MDYYDVLYLNPKGIQGIQYAIQAETSNDAKEYAPKALSVNSPFSAEEFKVLSVRKSINPPIQDN